MSHLKLINILMVGIKERLVYPSEVYISIIWAALESLITFFLWNSIFSPGQAKEMFMYSVISICIREIISNEADLYIARMIREGNLQSKLLLPINFVAFLMFKKLGESLFVFVTTGLPLIALAFLITQHQFNTINIITFIFSLLVSWSIMYYFQVLISLIALINTRISTSIPVIRSTMIKLFGGFLFPITLYPKWLHEISLLTPFPSIFFVPSSILTNFSNFNVVEAILNQLFWLIILYIITSIGWFLLVKRLTVFGG